MRSPEQLAGIMDFVCADVSRRALGEPEVAETLIVVANKTATVGHAGGLDVFEDGGVIAFVNNSGVPFVEQTEDLIARAAKLEPEAVLLGGSALTGRPGGAYRRVLAVQMFSARLNLRRVKVAKVEPSRGPIESIGAWTETRPGPPVWAEKVFDQIR
jgi:hypothetical protein